MAIEKILSCICVVMILMSVVPVSVFATSSSDNTIEITSRSNETFFVESEELLDVVFEGTVTEVATGLNDWICEAKVDKVISGEYIFEGETVHITLSLLPCGTWDDVEEGDKIKVYGQSFPTYCLDCPLQVSVCGRSSYYLKKISSECLSISVWTDKSKYNIGETVTIYYQTNTACTAKLTVTKPDGTQVVVGGPNDIPICTRSKSAAAGYPTGTRTVTFEARTSDKTKIATCYFDVVEDEEETKPVPKITKVGIDPSTCVKEDEYATIYVTVANNGGASSEGYISVSFPNDEYVYVVSGTGNKYNTVYQKKDLIWNSAGVQMKAVYPLVELYDTDWKGGQKETITMNVKPNSGSDEIEFLVRAALKNDADGDYERDPTYSGDTDQQGWYVKKYSVDVCDILYEIKFEGKVIEPDNEYLDDCFDCKVKIDRIITNPGNIDIKEGDEVLVEKFIWCDPGGTVDDWYFETGDKVEVYGKISKGDFSCSGHSDSSFRLDICGSSSYYFKKICPGPDPEITKVEYPTACVKEDEYATISVTVANNGGASSEGYISVSFPNDEDVYVVSGTGNKYNKVYQKKDPIWNSAGVQMKAVYPLVELFDNDWGKYQKETITMNVKPNSGSDEIVFYVRAALKNDADGDYERDPTYSGDKDQQGWYVKKYSVDVCDYEKVKIRGEIIADLPIISYYNFDVKIYEVLEDPTGNLQEGETVNVYGHRDGPAQVDDVTVGDEVEVFGEYRGYGGEYKQIFLSEWGDSSSDHYVKKIEPSFELISPDLTSELELYKTHNIHIRVKSSTTKGGTIVASLMFTSKFEKSQREVIINLKDDDLDGIYEYDYSLEPFVQIAMDSVNNSVKTKDAEALYNSICDYFSSTIGTYNLTLKYYDESSEKAEYLDTQSLSICSPYLRGYNWKWEIEKFINDDTFQPPSERMWGGHWTTLEDVQESMTETVLYLSEDNEGTAYLDLGMTGTNLLSFGTIGLIYGVTLANSLRAAGEEDKANEVLHKTLVNFVIGFTPIGWVKTFYDVANDLSIIFTGEKIFIMRSECPVNLHMYDSSNNHVGLDEYGNSETEIPYSIYVQDENGDFEGILIIDFDSDDFYEVVIEGTGNGKFNLTSDIIGQDKKQKIAYLNVPVYTNTIAEIDISSSNPDYTMKIDEDGDGTPEYEKKPDSIETIGCTYDHDGDGIVEDDIDDLIMATDAYLGFNTGTEYDADGDGIVEDDIDDLIMATDAYLGFITCEEEGR